VTVTVRALLPVGLDDELDLLGAVAAAVAVAKPAGAAVEVWIVGRAVTEDLARDALRLGADSVEVVEHGAVATADQFVAVFSQVLCDSGAAMEKIAALTLLPAGSAAEEIAARLAPRMRGTALGRCQSIAIGEDGVVAKRAAFGGRVVATLRCAAPAFATMRMSKAAVPKGEAKGRMRRHTLDFALPEAPRVTRREIGQGKRRLEGARIVVSGGRGMAGAEGFALLESLASSLAAAVGGSLPTVDAGWVPVACQVGQSGKFVTPEVYIAVAISGTPQHLAGVGAGTRIVAINKDAQADIFRVADIGVVGDWKDVVPALVDRLRRG
jgi:electron transfer flavoprotein alpha subunit